VRGRLKQLLGALSTRRNGRTQAWLYAEDVLSAVTYAECERLAELARGALVLELGSYYGRSTVALASTARRVHSVDPHQGGPDESPNTLPEFLANLERYGVRDNVVVHVGTSTQIAPLLQDAFDLIFVDAMHQRPQVDVDLGLSARCVRPGGCIALHDYGVAGVSVGTTWHPFGVTEAVDEFVALAGLAPPEVIETLAVVRSPATTDGPNAAERWQRAIAALPQARAR
jgi:SAM-dependent methyltransferase